MTADELRDQIREALRRPVETGGAPAAPYPARVRLPDGSLYDIDQCWPGALSLILDVTPCRP